MLRSVRALKMAMVLGVLATVSAAQSLTVPDRLTVGNSITIGYSDASRAGQTVTVIIDSGQLPEPVIQQVQISLDGSGNGTATWNVPNWDLAKFNAPGVQEAMRVIYPGVSGPAAEVTWTEELWSLVLSLLK